MPEFTEVTEHIATVVASGHVQVARDTITLRDGKPIGRERHRWVLAPGADLTGQPENIAAIARAAWTPAVLAAFEASLDQE